MRISYYVTYVSEIKTASLISSHPEDHLCSWKCEASRKKNMILVQKACYRLQSFRRSIYNLPGVLT